KLAGKFLEVVAASPLARSGSPTQSAGAPPTSEIEFGPAAGFGGLLPGYDLRRSQHPLSGGLGAPARWDPHPDEIGALDPRTGTQASHGRAGGFPAQDEPAVYRDDPRPGQGRQPASAQEGSPQNGQTSGSSPRACPALPGPAGPAMGADPMDARTSRTGLASDG